LKASKINTLLDVPGFLTIWVSISSASVIVVLSNAPAEVCAFWRTFLTSMIFAPITLARRKFAFKLHHALSGVFLGLHFVFWMQSLFLLPVYQSTLIVVTYPVFNVLLDYLFFDEKPGLRKMLGFSTALILLWLFLQVNNLMFNYGVLLAFAAALFAAGYFEIGRYVRSRLGESTLSYATPTYLTASAVALTYSILNGSDIFSYTLETYTAFILMAIIPMIGGHTLMNYYMKKYPASTVTSIALGEPFGAGLLGMLLLSQPLAPLSLFIGFLNRLLNNQLYTSYNLLGGILTVCIFIYDVK